MEIILHITSQKEWSAAQKSGRYRGDTLDTQGFIHCSTPQQLVRVANAYFAGQSGLVLLCIDPGRVLAEIRHEALTGAEQFPHIYGPLNLDAVIKMLAFKPGPDGQFTLPDIKGA